MPAGAEQAKLHPMDPGYPRPVSFCTCGHGEGDRYVRLLQTFRNLTLKRRCRGTGASCIYPLLGCRVSPSWKFIATGRVDTDGQGMSSDGLVSQRSTHPPMNVQLPISHLTDFNHGYTSTKRNCTNRSCLPCSTLIHSISRCATLPSTQTERKSRRVPLRRNSLLPLSARAQTRR